MFVYVGQSFFRFFTKKKNKEKRRRIKTRQVTVPHVDAELNSVPVDQTVLDPTHADEEPHSDSLSRDVGCRRNHWHNIDLIG